MKYSKKQIKEKTLADHNVAKIVEGIVRTKRDSDMRNLMVETFETFFYKGFYRVDDRKHWI